MFLIQMLLRQQGYVVAQRQGLTERRSLSRENNCEATVLGAEGGAACFVTSFKPHNTLPRDLQEPADHSKRLRDC